MSLSWSAQQQHALTSVARWMKNPEPQVFRLFGFAGTGKTTLARHIAEANAGEVVFGAFTGKAALVLRSKGCRNASTIHSLIYRALESDTEMPTFELNAESPAAKADLIIIDECSMVDADLGRDLLSFGKPVLVLGDPAQLPPVRGGGFFTSAQPDVMRTEVHRQAADNPIIRMSMRVREGQSLDYGEFGASRVIARADVDASVVLAADQVLVGRNKTRRLYNGRLRALRGYGGTSPCQGEKLVCLRNNKKKGLLNGGLWTVNRVLEGKRGFLKMSVAPEEGTGRRPIRIAVLPNFFEGTEDELAFILRRESDEFDYGYALTVHKAQGSQWNHVVLFDESSAFRDDRNRWLYTGITRAAEKLIVVR
jgi:ATP-dependent exoDNAse (exonuclease V) alpha subunit